MPIDRILFIDAYDSFSNSIIALLSHQLSISVESIKIDDPRFILNDEAFYRFLDGFSAVVAGPGPGHPARTQDVGLIGKLWNLPEQHILPVLGICLGFQSLCRAFGGHVERLNTPSHGIVSVISHSDTDVFEGNTNPLVVTQYHSLHVRLGDSHSEPCDLWSPSDSCPHLIPLAWDLMNTTNGHVLMAVRHRTLPFWGVQYHPESICTNDSGKQIIRKWWQEVMFYSKISLRKQTVCLRDSPRAPRTDMCDLKEIQENSPLHKVEWASIRSQGYVDVANLVELLHSDARNPKPILLESGVRDGSPVNPETGRFSIIGLQDASSMYVRYYTGNSTIELTRHGTILSQESMNVRQALAHLDGLNQAQKADGGSPDIPFWGGFVGYVSYEAGLQTIDVAPPLVDPRRPDMWFVLIQRSVVVDHVDKIVYLQTIQDRDGDWLQKTHTQVAASVADPQVLSPLLKDTNMPHATMSSEPNREVYLDQIRRAQDHLRAGDSYELCLTDQTAISSNEQPWDFYKRLRRRNPAPFGSFISLESDDSRLSIASSSPERFLSWDRLGRCQFRPIKGTVKKAPGVTRAHAEEILNSPKERAENLMIVDLIRHDLATVTGPMGVHVPKLMSIEEYATVYQLVSVIEGTLPPGTPGISALAASLPPGSMTGAPKKRSCELLQALERNSPRGLYSGVIGYLDVGGGGDFSVVIRTAFKWDDGNSEGDRYGDSSGANSNGIRECVGGKWQIGAGGAITVLSESEAEWEEMLAKRESVLKSFLP